jgi:uncharacterized protein (TIGR03546 family)
MLLRLIRPLRVLARLLTAAGTPRQLALGLAMGMLIGMVPKGNLTAVVLTVMLLAGRFNLGAGMVAAAVFSWLGMLVDPLSHRIGQALLTCPSLQPTWAFLYDQPLAPWTGFHNTVVLGSLLLGLWLFYPVYRLAEPAFAHVVPRVVDRLREYRISRLLFGMEMVADGSALSDSRYGVGRRDRRGSLREPNAMIAERSTTIPPASISRPNPKTEP